MTKQLSMQSALVAIREELVNLRSKYSRINEDIQNIQNEMDVLKNSPISKDDLPRYVRRFVHEKGEEFASNLLIGGMFNKSHRADGNALHSAPWGSMEASGIGGYFFEARRALTTDFFGMLCFFSPEVVVAKLSERITGFNPDIWDSSAIPAVQREERIAELIGLLGGLEGEGRSLASQIGEITAAIDS